MPCSGSTTESRATGATRTSATTPATRVSRARSRSIARRTTAVRRRDRTAARSASRDAQAARLRSALPAATRTARPKAVRTAATTAPIESEGSSCSLARRLDVAAIQCHEPRRDLPDRLRLVAQHASGGFRHPGPEATDHVELPDEDRGRRRRCLSDLIERELDEPLDPDRRDPHPELTLRVVPVALELRVLGQH